MGAKEDPLLLISAESTNCQPRSISTMPESRDWL